MHSIHNLQYSSVWSYDMSLIWSRKIREVFHSNNKHILCIIHVNGKWEDFKELTLFRSPNLIRKWKVCKTTVSQKSAKCVVLLTLPCQAVYKSWPTTVYLFAMILVWFPLPFRKEKSEQPPHRSIVAFPGSDIRIIFVDTTLLTPESIIAFEDLCFGSTSLSVIARVQYK